jgi:hypothetical protein
MSQSTDRPANDPERADEHPTEPGAYIGREPERAADTIPGGVRRDDARISAGDTQSTGVGAPDERGQPPQEPGGHRGGGRADDDDIREADADR